MPAACSRTGCRCFSPTWEKLLRQSERRGSCCCCTGLWLCLLVSTGSDILELNQNERRSRWEFAGSEDAVLPLNRQHALKASALNSPLLSSVSGLPLFLLLFLHLFSSAFRPDRAPDPPCPWLSVGVRTTRRPTMWTGAFSTTAASSMHSTWSHMFFSSSSLFPSSSLVSLAGRLGPHTALTCTDITHSASTQDVSTSRSIGSYLFSACPCYCLSSSLFTFPC